jgi:phosphoserine phosphatase
MMEELGIKPSRAAYVGDSDPDIGLARVVELPIAYHTQSQGLIEACKVVLGYGELGKIREILEKY